MKKAAAFMVLLVAGCAGPEKPVYLNRDMTRIAVLKPFSQMLDERVENRVWPHVEQAVGHRGYGLVDHSTLEAFYTRNKFTYGQEIRQFTTEELCKELTCDGVLYTSITRCGEQTLLIHKSVGVGLEVELADGKDGAILWRGEGEASRSETATSWGDAIVMAAQTMIDRLIESGLIDELANGACRECFHRMPLPGHQPKEQKEP